MGATVKIDAARVSGARSPPLVSVIMPVRDGMAFLDEAIEYIRGQTYSNWELIVIDDGSTDDTSRLLTQWERRDGRIRVIRSVPIGLIAALNIGVAHACGEYIARMDADDISNRWRLGLQVALMERCRGLLVTGTAIQLIGDRAGFLFTPMTDWGCRGRLLFENCFAHPTVMLRRSGIDDVLPLYDFAHEGAEDYGAWVRISDSGRFANLPWPLVKYRVHARQVSTQKALALYKAHAAIAVAQWRRFGIHVDAEAFLRFRWPDFSCTTFRIFLVEGCHLAVALAPLMATRFAPQLVVWILAVWFKAGAKAAFSCFQKMFRD